MLGNWSFGDYFKRDAIQWAWELLTDVCKLPHGQLWVTVYHTDDEAYDIWANDIGVPQRTHRAHRRQQGRAVTRPTISGRWPTPARAARAPRSSTTTAPDIAGGPPGSPDEDGDRYIEIWNLVFMQFDRAADGTLSKLPKPASIPAWASSASRPCCSTCIRTTRSISSST